MTKAADFSASGAAAWESISASGHFEISPGPQHIGNAVAFANTDDGGTIVPRPTSVSSAEDGFTQGTFASFDKTRWRKWLFLCKTGGTW